MASPSEREEEASKGGTEKGAPGGGTEAGRGAPGRRRRAGGGAASVLDRDRFQEEVARELGVDLSRPGPVSPEEVGAPPRTRRRRR